MSYVPKRQGFNSARFAEVIRQSRFTREQVAVGSGLNLRTIQMWAKGTHVPQAPKLARAAAFLNVDPDIFFDRDEA